MNARPRAPAGAIDWRQVHERLARARRATEESVRLSPERARAVMEERARTLARVPPRAPAAAEVLEVVTFRLAGERYAVETSHVREVVRFADFTPVATQRGLYASADFTVPGTVAKVSREPNTTAQLAGFNFELVTPPVFQAGKVADLKFRIESQGREKIPVPLQPVMGAFAHLVAFDEARSGFAHLHPAEIDLSKPPDALRPELNFKVTIPAPGRYVIWAQVNLDGSEAFVPFWVDVAP